MQVLYKPLRFQGFSSYTLRSGTLVFRNPDIAEKGPQTYVEGCAGHMLFGHIRPTRHVWLTSMFLLAAYAYKASTCEPRAQKGSLPHDALLRPRQARLVQRTPLHISSGFAVSIAKRMHGRG